MAITITLNGETKTLDAPMSLKAFVESLELDPRGVAVERNLAIVPKSAYEETMLADGDRLELVHFVGGGDAPAAEESKQ